MLVADRVKQLRTELETGLLENSHWFFEAAPFRGKGQPTGCMFGRVPGRENA